MLSRLYRPTKKLGRLALLVCVGGSLGGFLGGFWGSFWGGSLTSAQAQPLPDAWREPQDTVSALFEPDRYAWRLFVALNWAADSTRKVADQSKPFGAPGPVVWETWRNVRPDAPDTVLPLNGGDPGPWLGTGAPAVARQQQQFDRVPVQQQMFAASQRRGPATARPAIAPAFDPPVESGSEVRLNQSAYDFIRQNRLYNIEGQVAHVKSGLNNLNFPANTKEIKAQWRKIKETDKPRYHWAEITLADGRKEPWGLTALHISTKDVPNWFWSTFEHIDNKAMGPTEGGGPPNVGWQTKSVDRFACPTAPHDCELAPAGIGLENTKWANYRLRGTQLDFVDSIGNPIILANAQIEQPFQRRSSCVTCHALATINREGSGLPFTLAVGVPDPNWFRDPQTQQRIYMQLDFMWSLTRASSSLPQ